jgi:cupin fold WbuC family metalloprotein
MQTRAESAEVFYPGEDPVLVGASDIDRLKRTARTSPRKRARLCTHQTPADQLHQMLITLPREAYVRPHKHVGKSESMTILQGEADLILFHDDGRVRQVIPLGPLESKKHFYYRTAQAVYHTLIVRSEVLVFQEVTDGPFRREQTVFPDWAPDDTDESSARSFNARFQSPSP